MGRVFRDRNNYKEQKLRLNPAEYVIHMFDGVRPLARAIKKSPSTVCLWRKVRTKNGGQKGRIPSSSHVPILNEARSRGLDITPDDLIYGRELKSNNRE